MANAGGVLAKRRPNPRIQRLARLQTVGRLFVRKKSMNTPECPKCHWNTVIITDYLDGHKLHHCPDCHWWAHEYPDRKIHTIYNYRQTGASRADVGDSEAPAPVGEA